MSEAVEFTLPRLAHISSAFLSNDAIGLLEMGLENVGPGSGRAVVGRLLELEMVVAIEDAALPLLHRPSTSTAAVS